MIFFNVFSSLVFVLIFSNICGCEVMTLNKSFDFDLFPGSERSVKADIPHKSINHILNLIKCKLKDKIKSREGTSLSHTKIDLRPRPQLFNLFDNVSLKIDSDPFEAKLNTATLPGVISSLPSTGDLSFLSEKSRQTLNQLQVIKPNRESKSILTQLNNTSKELENFYTALERKCDFTKRFEGKKIDPVRDFKISQFSKSRNHSMDISKYLKLKNLLFNEAYKTRSTSTIKSRYKCELQPFDQEMNVSVQSKGKGLDKNKHSHSKPRQKLQYQYKTQSDSSLEELGNIKLDKGYIKSSLQNLSSHSAKYGKSNVDRFENQNQLKVTNVVRGKKPCSKYRFSKLKDMRTTENVINRLLDVQSRDNKLVAIQKEELRKSNKRRGSTNTTRKTEDIHVQNKPAGQGMLRRENKTKSILTEKNPTPLKHEGEYHITKYKHLSDQHESKFVLHKPRSRVKDLYLRIQGTQMSQNNNGSNNFTNEENEDKVNIKNNHRKTKVNFQTSSKQTLKEKMDEILFMEAITKKCNLLTRRIAFKDTNDGRQNYSFKDLTSNNGELPHILDENYFQDKIIDPSKRFQEEMNINPCTCKHIPENQTRRHTAKKITENCSAKRDDNYFQDKITYPSKRFQGGMHINPCTCKQVKEIYIKKIITENSSSNRDNEGSLKSTPQRYLGFRDQSNIKKPSICAPDADLIHTTKNVYVILPCERVLKHDFKLFKIPIPEESIQPIMNGNSAQISHVRLGNVPVNESPISELKTIEVTDDNNRIMKEVLKHLYDSVLIENKPKSVVQNDSPKRKDYMLMAKILKQLNEVVDKLNAIAKSKEENKPHVCITARATVESDIRDEIYEEEKDKGAIPKKNGKTENSSPVKKESDCENECTPEKIEEHEVCDEITLQKEIYSNKASEEKNKKHHRINGDPRKTQARSKNKNKQTTFKPFKTVNVKTEEHTQNAESDECTEVMKILEKVLENEERRRKSKCTSTVETNVKRKSSRKKNQNFYDDCYNALLLLENMLTPRKVIPSPERKNPRTGGGKNSVKKSMEHSKVDSDDKIMNSIRQYFKPNTTRGSSLKKKINQELNNEEFEHTMRSFSRMKKELRKDNTKYLNTILTKKLLPGTNFIERVILHSAKRNHSQTPTDFFKTVGHVKAYREKMNCNNVERSPSTCTHVKKHGNKVKLRESEFRNIFNKNYPKTNIDRRFGYLTPNIQSHKSKKGHRKRHKEVGTEWKNVHQEQPIAQKQIKKNPIITIDDKHKIYTHPKTKETLAEIDHYVGKINRKHFLEQRQMILNRLQNMNNAPQKTGIGNLKLTNVPKPPMKVYQTVSKSGKFKLLREEKNPSDNVDDYTDEYDQPHNTRGNIEEIPIKYIVKDITGQIVPKYNRYQKQITHEDKSRPISLKNRQKGNVVRVRTRQRIKSNSTFRKRTGMYSDEKYETYKPLVDSFEKEKSHPYELNEYEVTLGQPDLTNPIHTEEMMCESQRIAKMLPWQKNELYEVSSPDEHIKQRLNMREKIVASNKNHSRNKTLENWKSKTQISAGGSNFETPGCKLMKYNGTFYYPCDYYLYEYVDHKDTREPEFQRRPKDVKKRSKQLETVAPTLSSTPEVIDNREASNFVLNYTKILHIYPGQKGIVAGHHRVNAKGDVNQTVQLMEHRTINSNTALISSSIDNRKQFLKRSQLNSTATDVTKTNTSVTSIENDSMDNRKQFLKRSQLNITATDVTKTNTSVTSIENETPKTVRHETVSKHITTITFPEKFTTLTTPTSNKSTNEQSTDHKDIHFKLGATKHYDMSEFLIDDFLKKPDGQVSDTRWMRQNLDFRPIEPLLLKKSDGIFNDLSEFHTDDVFLQKPNSRKPYLNKYRETINEPPLNPRISVDATNEDTLKITGEVNSHKEKLLEKKQKKVTINKSEVSSKKTMPSNEKKHVTTKKTNSNEKQIIDNKLNLLSQTLKAVKFKPKFVHGKYCKKHSSHKVKAMNEKINKPTLSQKAKSLETHNKFSEIAKKKDETGNSRSRHGSTALRKKVNSPKRKTSHEKTLQRSNYPQKFNRQAVTEISDIKEKDERDLKINIYNITYLPKFIECKKNTKCHHHNSNTSRDLEVQKYRVNESLNRQKKRIVNPSSHFFQDIEQERSSLQNNTMSQTKPIDFSIQNDQRHNRSSHPHSMSCEQNEFHFPQSQTTHSIESERLKQLMNTIKYEFHRYNSDENRTQLIFDKELLKQNPIHKNWSQLFEKTSTPRQKKKLFSLLKKGKHTKHVLHKILKEIDKAIGNKEFDNEVMKNDDDDNK